MQKRSAKSGNDDLSPDDERLPEGLSDGSALLSPLVRQPGEPDHWTFYLKVGEDIRDDSYSRRTARRRMVRARNQEFLAHWRASKNRWDGGAGSVRKADLEAVTRPIRCAACGNWFPAARSDAKTCSPKCRTALCRKRKRQSGE
jgi:hypothetical protein